jgi:hypothetical protein
MILGFDRNWVTDQHQALIHYARLGSPAAIHEQLAALGVSHLIWKGQSIRRDSLAEDLAFFNYALNYTVERRQFGGFSIGTLPAKPPRTRRRDYEVALYGCGRPYRSGAYDLEQLSLPVLDPGPRPQPWTDLDDLKSEADSFDFVVVDGSCRTERDPPGFVLAAMRGSSYLYVRSPPRDR